MTRAQEVIYRGGNPKLLLLLIMLLCFQLVGATVATADVPVQCVPIAHISDMMRVNPVGSQDCM